MEKSQVLALMNKLNKLNLDDNRNDLMHKVNQQATITNAIREISVREKRTFAEVKAEIEAMLK